MLAVSIGGRCEVLTRIDDKRSVGGPWREYIRARVLYEDLEGSIYRTTSNASERAINNIGFIGHSWVYRSSPVTQLRKRNLKGRAIRPSARYSYRSTHHAHTTTAAAVHRRRVYYDNILLSVCTFGVCVNSMHTFQIYIYIDA